MTIIKDKIISIDPDKKVLEYASGKTVPLSEKASFGLFASQAQKDISEGVKKSELSAHKAISNVSGSPALNTFLKNLSDNTFTRIATDYIADPATAGVAGLWNREGQEEKGYFGRIGEDYIAQRMGRREARGIIDKEAPGAALAGKVGAVGIDLAMPLGPIGESPAATGALFGLGSSERSLFEDPKQALTQTAVGGALGYGVGKVSGALGKVAAERKAIREFPALEEEAKRAYQQKLLNFRSNVGKKLAPLERDIGKYGVSSESLALDEFVNKEISFSHLAGTSEGKNIENFITKVSSSLPETMTAADIQKLYEAIEMRTARGVAEELPVLESLKTHLVNTIPIGAAKNKMMGKICPKVERQFGKIIDDSFESLPKNVIKEVEAEFGIGTVKELGESVKISFGEYIQSLSHQEFIEMLGSGDVSPFVDFLSESEMFKAFSRLSDYKMMKYNLPFPGGEYQRASFMKNNIGSSVYEAETRFKDLPNKLKRKLQSTTMKNWIDASVVFDETTKKVSSRISHATGVPNPLTGRSPTNTPIGPFTAPQPPQAGRMAERFESKPLGFMEKSAFGASLGFAGKMLGIPKIGAAIGGFKAGKAGLEGALRGLTSPGALGDFVRQGMQGGG